MSLAAIVQELTELPEHVLSDYVAARASEDCSPEALIVLVAALRDVIQDMGALKQRIAEDLGSEYAPTRTVFQVPELGPVEVGHSNVRSAWDKSALLPQALTRITDQPGVLADGDGLTHPPAVIAQNIYGELAKVVTFGNPKLPGLRALGLDPDEWCSSRWETQVSLPARQI